MTRTATLSPSSRSSTINWAATVDVASSDQQRHEIIRHRPEYVDLDLGAILLEEPGPGEDQFVQTDRMCALDDGREGGGR